jgi:transposase
LNSVSGKKNQLLWLRSWQLLKLSVRQTQTTTIAMADSTSIYSKQNPKIHAILDQAGNSRKVLAVALDYAKSKHMALFCNGLGDVLKKPFAVENSRHGLEGLLEEVQSTCTHRAIDRQHVVFGGEDRPTYAQNFIDHLCQKGYLVVRVNAWEAKQQRDNHQASTDSLDLCGIAKTMLQQGSYSARESSETYEHLREISRCRSYMVGEQTAIKLHLHGYIDRLFPGFLDPRQSGITPFSSAAVALMRCRFSAQQIGRRRLSSLRAELKRHRVAQPDAVAQQLQELARQALSAAPEHLSTWQSSLEQCVRVYQQLDQSILALDQELAHWLALSPAALLTSIRGIGVVLAAGLVGEIGDPAQWRGLRQTCSYVGIIPGVEQTGGPDKPAHTTGVKRRCNRRAKNWVVQAGSHLGKHGPSPLHEQYRQLLEKGQHADFVMSRRLLRISKDLMRRGSVYRPKELLDPNTSTQKLANYYQQLWPILLDKWSGLLRWDHLFNPQNPLGRWRQMVQELYQICLPLPHEPGRSNHARPR